MRASLGAVLLVLLAGCNLRDPVRVAGDADLLVVHSVLHAGAEIAAVLLQRGVPATGALGPPLAPVTDATVTLRQDGATLPLRHSHTGCFAAGGAPAPPIVADGCYAGEMPGGIRAGERSELAVELPGGGGFQGSAFVPAPPAITRPAAGRADVTVQEITGGTILTLGLAAGWTVPAAAGLIEVRLIIDSLFHDGAYAPESSCGSFNPIGENRRVGTDTARALLFNFQCQFEPPAARWDSLSARLLVTAYDSAYARYADEVLKGRSVRIDGDNGAVGVFAGAATATRNLRVIRTP